MYLTSNEGRDQHQSRDTEIMDALHDINNSKYFVRTKINQEPSEDTESMNSLSTLSHIPGFGLIRKTIGLSDFAAVPIELFQGAILGRTVVSRVTNRKRRPRNSEDMKHVDIGIGYRDEQGKNDDGVSRRQVEVLRMNDRGILVKIYNGVKNSIAIRSGSQEERYGPGNSLLLSVGDQIIFDTYMKRPRHIFKLVAICYA